MRRVAVMILLALGLVGCLFDNDAQNELRRSLGPHGESALSVHLVAEGEAWRLIAFRASDGMVCDTVVREVDGQWQNEGIGCDQPGPLEHPGLFSFEVDDGVERKVWLWRVSVETVAIEAELHRGQPPEERRTVKVPVVGAGDLGLFFAPLEYDSEFLVADSVALDADGEALWSRSGHRW